MAAQYTTPWQRPSYPPYDAPSRQIYPNGSNHEHSGYPPQATTTTAPYHSQPNGVPAYDPNFLAPKKPYRPADEDTLRGRTPSPTPSEAKELRSGAIDWKAMSNWRFWIRREWLWYYVALVIILVLSALMTLYHKQIVHWLTPVTRWLHDLSFGWVVPIAVLFVISFPPLFGHEIVAVLCGLVWGLWVGFGIVAAGTFLGEVGNFYAFKYCCRSRGEKLERTSISYACLARVVREGGFKIALIARLSAIPGHFTTAVFSTCGMGIIVFSIAAILSMPKQFITVYLGVILEQSATGVTDTKSRIISDVVLAVTILITVLAMWYIFRQMNKVKPAVIYARRKARQAKLEREHSFSGVNGHAQDASYSSFGTMDYSYANGSESEVPLTSWAKPMGHTPGFPQPRHFQGSVHEDSSEQLHAPVPRRAGGSPIPAAEPENEEVPGSAEPLRAGFDHARRDSNAQNVESYQSHTPKPRVPLETYPGPTSLQSTSVQTPADTHMRNGPLTSHSSKSHRNTTPGSPQLQSTRLVSSSNYPPPDSTRPDRSPSPLMPPNNHESFGLVGRPLVPGPIPALSDPSNDRYPSVHGQSPMSLDPTRGYHIPEESYDSFHTARSNSPEPISTSDRLPGGQWYPPPSSSQQLQVGQRGEQFRPPSYNSSWQ